MKKIKAWFSNLKCSDKWCIGIFLLVNINILLYLLLNMKYFYLDNPTVLWLANNTKISNLFFTPVQRFFPMSFLIQILSADVFHNSIIIHYIVQFIIFFIGVIVLNFFLKDFVKKSYQRIIIISLLYILTPFAENMFTVGKMEIMLCTGFIILFSSIYKILYGEVSNKRIIIQYLIFEAVIIYILLTKETSIVAIIPLILLLIYGCLYNRKILSKAFSLFLIFIINYGLLVIYKHFYVIQNSYTDVTYSFHTFIHNVLWYSYYNFDVFIVGIIGGILLLIEFLKDRKNNRTFYLLVINITGWGYFFGICLWRWSLSYYIYPIAFLFSVSIAEIFIIKIKNRYITKGFILIASFIVLYGLNYNYKVAASHIDLGKIYSKSVEDLVNDTDNGSRVLFENYNFYEEPIAQTRILLKCYNKNINIFGINQNLTGIKLDKNLS